MELKKIGDVDSSLDFLTEVVMEGRIRVIVPNLKAYVTEVWEYAPSKAPVFFNPVMALNRDLAVLVLQTYQKLVGKKVAVCEPLAGCGIRGIRFAAEVEGVRQIVLSDINPKATKLALLNVKRNTLEELILVVNEDANLLLSRHAVPFNRFDFIDVDPFGSPAPYLDSTIRALRDGGLLALTATDMAPLCGVHPRACFRKYGGKPMRTEYCHELAIRLLIGCLAMTAAKHGIGVKVVFSHSTDHYIRVYAVIKHGARQADNNIKEMGYVLHCFMCLHRETSKGIISHLKQKCSQCGYPLNVAGPLWLGKIFDENYSSLMKKEIAGRNLTHKKKIFKMISLIQKEADGPVAYYTTDKICDKLNLPTPPLIKVIDQLKSEGFQATPTHFNSTGIRTDASIKIVKEIIYSL